MHTERGSRYCYRKNPLGRYFSTDEFELFSYFKKRGFIFQMNGVPFSEKEVSYNGGYAKFIINQTRDCQKIVQLTMSQYVHETWSPKM